MKFSDGFVKVAAHHDEDDGSMRRAIIGAPLSAAWSAKKGKKLDAFTESYGNVMKHNLKGAVSGGKWGAIAGVPVGLATAALAAKHGKGGKLKNALKGGAAGLLGSAAIGTGIGSVGGQLKGHLGSEAAAIEKKHRK